MSEVETLPSISQLREKLIKARCRLHMLEPWYGHIAMSMTWKHSDFPWMSDEKDKTMGVRIVHGGMIECVWYPGFVHSQSLKQLYGVIYHEIEHIIRLHCVRGASTRNHTAWNVACDSVINGKKSKPLIGYVESNVNKRTLPLDGNCVWLPETWPERETAETYYERLIKQGPLMPCKKCRASGKTYDEKGKGKGKEDRCPTCGGNCGSDEGGSWDYGGVGGSLIDDHSVWSQSTVSADEARQIVKDLVTEATSKNPGNVPGHLSEAIKELNKPKVRWRALLRHFIGTHVGNKRLTYNRRNRRHDGFGIKGISKHAAGKVRVIVDTSGSVSKLELQQAFTEIDMISSYADVSVLLWDHAYQGFNKYRRNDWKKWKANGRGGTDMEAPIKWLEEHSELGDCVIMITDGYCTFATQRPWFPACGMITIITRSDSIEPSWGHVVRLKVSE